MQVLAGIGGTVVGDPWSEGPRGINFRPLRFSDLPLVHRWINVPHVSRWWYGDDTSWHGVEREYVPYIEGREPVEPYLILLDNKPIGYIQSYPISHDEDYARLIGVKDTAGVDMFIGDEDVRVCVIGPEPKNVAAIWAYEKAGFRFFKTLQVPGEFELEHLMRIERGEVLGA